MPTDNKILNGSGLTTLVSLIKKDINTVASSIPVNVSDLTNDAGYITAAEVTGQVQSDWAQATTTAVDFIKNKPVLPEYNILSYRGKSSSMAGGDNQYYLLATDIADGTTHMYSVPAYTTTPDNRNQMTSKGYVDDAITTAISNYVTTADMSIALTPYALASDLLQSDWNQTTTTSLDYIKNKPDHLNNEEPLVFNSNGDFDIEYDGSVKRIINEGRGINFAFGSEREEDGHTIQDGYIELRSATTTTIGGVILGNNITANGATISITATNITSALGFTPSAEGHTHSIDVIQSYTTGLQIASIAGTSIYAPDGLMNIGSHSGSEGTPTTYYDLKSILSATINVPAYSTSIISDGQVTTKKYVDDAITTSIAGIVGVDFNTSYTTYAEMITTTGSAGSIYLIPNSGETPNIYDEYIYANGSYEKIGTTEVDLSDYVTTTDMSTTLNNYVSNSALTTALTPYLTSVTVTSATTSGSTLATVDGKTIYINDRVLLKTGDIVNSNSTVGYLLQNLGGTSFKVPAYTDTIVSDSQVTTKKYVDDQINAVTAIIPGDTLVEQNPTTEGANLPIILKSTTATVGVTSSVKFAPTTVYVNPSSGKIKANRLEAATLTLTNNGVACGEIYGSRAPVYDSIIIKPANSANSIEITRDDVSGTYVSLGNNVRLYGITTPARNDAAANKKYVDDSISTGLTNYVAKSDVVAGLTSGVVVATIGDVDIYAPVAGEAPDLSGYVPSSRTVNGHALTTNISLTASDVGAATASHTHDYSKVTATAVTTTGTTLGTITVNNNGTTTTTTIYAPAVTWAYDTSTGMLTINGVGITTT